MGTLRKAVVMLLATAVVAVAGPVSAQVPEVPGVPEVPPGTVPPEVAEALADAISQLPSPLIPAVDGVGGASASPGHASSWVVDIPGTVTVGKSETTSNSSKVTILSAGGTDLLVREGDADGGHYTGELAPAGDAIDQVNEALCPGGPPAAGVQKTCVLVLYSSAKDTQVTPSVHTHSARFRALSVQTEHAPESLTVGSTTADSVRLPLPVFLGGPKCTDVATSFLLAGGGQLAAVYLLNPGGPLNGVGISANKAC